MTGKVGIIGAGVVGTAVGVILHRQGWEITGVYDVRPESTAHLAAKVGARRAGSPTEVARSADVVFVTTSDSAIQEVVSVVGREGGFRPGQVVVHMSGALSSAVLGAARDAGAIVLSVHPLQSFASVERAVSNLPGSVFSIEGDERGYEDARRIVEALGGEYFFISAAAKPLYHAAACVVSNYLVTVIDLGLGLMEAAGIPRRQALKAVLPLVQGTVANIAAVGIPAALTGPIARGDAATVQTHLAAMQDLYPQALPLYALLGEHTAQVAEAKGTIDAQMRRHLQELLRGVRERSQG
ncbi:MAG: DUF2520 domain-containing protein [Syntrophomonadaceae bacterium]|nr:DUF2520 domain-containing protein [Syntrophomonadaceae bacterium]